MNLTDLQGGNSTQDQSDNGLRYAVPFFYAVTRLAEGCVVGAREIHRHRGVLGGKRRRRPNGRSIPAGGIFGKLSKIGRNTDPLPRNA